jgi:hypothetical protein
MEEWGSESNGLENLTYCTFSKIKKSNMLGKARGFF